MNQTLRSVALGLVALWIPNALRSAGPLDPERPYLSTQDAMLRQAEQFEQQQQFQAAIPIYENLIQDGAGREGRWTAYVLFRLASAQLQSGDRVSALESATTAATLDPAEPSYQMFQSDLLGEDSGGRTATTYHARRDQGSAKRLIATNGVLHIFVRGKNTQPWYSEEEAKARLHIDAADRWLQARAAESRLARLPVFEHRFLMLADEPFWRRIDVPDTNVPPEYRKAWLDAILIRFQAGSYAELFDRVFAGMDLANRSVVFHWSTTDLALSVLQPYRKQPTDLESTFVPSETSERTALYGPVCYTHEFLHLYGADDLFNKARDPAAPENDVMSFGAYQLDDCVMSALTRYAVGWTEQPPHLKRLHLAEPAHPTKRKRGANG